MIININFWAKSPLPSSCSNYPQCENSLRPALIALGGSGVIDANGGNTIPNGHRVEVYFANVANPVFADAISLVGGLQAGSVTFGIEQGGGREIIVAKLSRGQVNSRNIELMVREILKLRPSPDGGYLYNPDFGLVKIGKKNDDPGGSLIALNPLGRPEAQLDFDRSGFKGLLDALKFGGLLALGFMLFDKSKNEKGAF